MTTEANTVLSEELVDRLAAAAKDGFSIAPGSGLALCATVKALRAENETLKAADYSALTSDVDEFRTRAVVLCKVKAEEWRSVAMKTTGVERDSFLSKVVAAEEFIVELEKL